MKIDHDKEISIISKRFRNYDPQLWDHFVNMVGDRSIAVTVAVTEAPPDQILVCQGMAKEARKMVQLLTELPDDPA